MARAGGAAALILWLAAGGAPAQTARPAKSPPARVPSPRIGPSRSRWVGERISLDFKDADLRDVLHAFSRLTGLNIAVDPEVRGSVTVRLHDVPWDQALDVILRVNGLGEVMEGNVMRVGLPSKL